VPGAPADWVARRNYFTLQYTYLRGDTSLVLINNTMIDPNYELLPPHLEQSSASGVPDFFSPYMSRVQAPERLGVLQDPVVLEILEHRWKGFELRWKKLLGKGGCGVATLWEVEFEDGHRMPIVLKINTEMDVADFRKEIEWHDHYKHASNIVQRLNLSELSREHRIDGRFDNRQDLEELMAKSAHPVLIIEYAQHGCLLDVLENIQPHAVRWTAAALWQLWEQRQFTQSSEALIPSLLPF
jgi:hypothetical protein